MPVHTVFDMLAWLTASGMARLVARKDWLGAAPRTVSRDPGYFIALGLGAILDAVAAGSFNMRLAGMLHRAIPLPARDGRHRRRRTV